MKLTRSSIICIFAVVILSILLIFLEVESMQKVEVYEYSQGISSFEELVSEPPTSEPSLPPTHSPSAIPTSNPSKSPSFESVSHYDLTDFIGARYFPLFSFIFIFVGSVTTILCQFLCNNIAKQSAYTQQDEDDNTTESAADSTDTDNGTDTSDDIISVPPTEYDTDLQQILAGIGLVASVLYVGGLAVNGKKSGKTMDIVDNDIQFAKKMAKNIRSTMMREYLRYAVGKEIYPQRNKPIFYQIRDKMTTLSQFHGCKEIVMDLFLVDFLSILGSQLLASDARDDSEDNDIGLEE